VTHGHAKEKTGEAGMWWVYFHHYLDIWSVQSQAADWPASPPWKFSSQVDSTLFMTLSKEQNIVCECMSHHLWSKLHLSTTLHSIRSQKSVISCNTAYPLHHHHIQNREIMNVTVNVIGKWSWSLDLDGSAADQERANIPRFIHL
jgi:hypothetical protein